VVEYSFSPEAPSLFATFLLDPDTLKKSRVAFAAVSCCSIPIDSGDDRQDKYGGYTYNDVSGGLKVISRVEQRWLLNSRHGY